MPVPLEASILRGRCLFLAVMGLRMEGRQPCPRQQRLAGQ